MRKPLPKVIGKLLLVMAIFFAIQAHCQDVSIHFPDIRLTPGGTKEVTVSYSTLGELHSVWVEFTLPEGLHLVDCQIASSLKSAYPQLSFGFADRDVNNNTSIIIDNFGEKSLPKGTNELMYLTFSADEELTLGTYPITTNYLSTWVDNKIVDLESQTFNIVVDAPIIIDGICYDVNKNDGTAEVSRLPRNQLYEGNINLPSTITFEGKSYVVKRIAKEAFSESLIESIVIPNNIDSIEDKAFIPCPNLKTVSIDNNKFVEEYWVKHGKNDWLVSKCQILFGEQVEEYILGDNITYVGCGAFFECEKLKFVTIGKGVRYIEEEVFYDCYNLTTVSFGNNVKIIGEYAFYGCQSLNSIELPNRLESIGEGAFDGCTTLETIIIPARVTNIGNYAFSLNISYSV